MAFPIEECYQTEHGIPSCLVNPYRSARTPEYPVSPIHISITNTRSGSLLIINRSRSTVDCPTVASSSVGVVRDIVSRYDVDANSYGRLLLSLSRSRNAFPRRLLCFEIWPNSDTLSFNGGDWRRENVNTRWSANWTTILLYQNPGYVSASAPSVSTGNKKYTWRPAGSNTNGLQTTTISRRCTPLGERSWIDHNTPWYTKSTGSRLYHPWSNGGIRMRHRKVRHLYIGQDVRTRKPTSWPNVLYERSPEK